MGKKLLDVRETSERLGVSTWSVYQMARTGALPVVRIGKQIRFDPDRLDEWIETGGTQSVASAR